MASLTSLPNTSMQVNNHLKDFVEDIIENNVDEESIDNCCEGTYMLIECSVKIAVFAVSLFTSILVLGTASLILPIPFLVSATRLQDQHLLHKIIASLKSRNKQN